MSDGKQHSGANGSIRRLFSSRRGMVKAGLVAMVALGAGAIAALVFAQPIIPTTINDFYMHGSQPTPPGDDRAVLLEPSGCGGCHGGYEESQSPYERWRYSMMAQAYRDPIFHAGLEIASNDVGAAKNYCLKCHAPAGWLEGRVTDDLRTLDSTDHSGVSCSICHRAVDPEYKPGVSPSVDQAILQGLGTNRPPTTGPGTPLDYAFLVIDPQDRRRGPFDLGEFYFHEWLESPLHRSSDLCAACHDVSNPALTRVRNANGSDTYVPNALNEPHPTGYKYDMYPIERLWSEWRMSAFAQGPVTQLAANPPDADHPGRFGGYQVSSYSTCSDCHQPAVQGFGCNPFLNPPQRNNVPQHNFSGANSWVLRAVNDLFPNFVTGLEDPQLIDEAIDRNALMMQRASDMELTVVGDQLKVRITNESGHKLPSGYAEGRRVWINVVFRNNAGQIVAERGAYNPATAVLSMNDTKVYETRKGLDATMAALTGLPEGESFRFALNNKIYFDNRIPPRGFNNAAFKEIQAEPKGYTYQDGQHWDDTFYKIPAGTARVEVRVLHQTTTKEYIEFLRDHASKPLASTDYIQPPAGSTAGTLGQIVYEQWVKFGRSEPVLLDEATIPARPCRADVGSEGGALGADGVLDNNDFIVFIGLFFEGNVLADLGREGGEAGSDGFFDNNDFIVFISAFFDGCQ